MIKKESHRLPDNVTPISYALTIEPSKEMDSYNGGLEIKATINKQTKQIILHSKNLEIEMANMCIGTQCFMPQIKKEEKTDLLILETLKPLPKGELDIHINFKGKITEDLAGIYRSKYEQEGKTDYIITTQCEAPYARRIFPCFDEPDKKATFDLTVIIEKDLKAISNEQIKSESIENEKNKIIFKTTPKMPTYLFYLGIGKFEFSEDIYRNIKIRIATTPSKNKNTKFALDYTKKYLEYFENYSKIPYPLEKLDMIAIPDFGAGAMENWGAITFREILLLVDEKTSSVNIKKRAAEVIAHELWHQWSGNLVTMKWWNDLWLNESFATYMAYKAVAHYNPEWNIWDDYLSGELASGLFKDSLKTTHPIEVKVNSPEEIEEIFDEISYAKGGCILRMLESHMGEEQFRLGVSEYLKKYSYSNASASDLWDSLDKISKEKKVKELMKYWISEPGYPLISLEKSKDKLKISQERYNKKTGQVWPVPITIYGPNSTQKILLNKKNDIIKSNENVVKLNHKQFGFYRTKYSNEIMQNLGFLIKEKKLEGHDRWGMHNDLWALCSTGKEKIETYIKFLDNYLYETNYNILVEISASLRKIDRLFYYEKWWPKSKQKIIQKFLPLYKNKLKSLGWDKIENEPIENSLLRNMCINFCGFANDPQTVSEAKSRYEKGNIDLNIANSVYSIIAQDGNQNDFNIMLEKYERSTDIEQKIKLLTALYLFKNEEILKQALDISLTERVRSQNIRYIFSTVIINPAAQKILINWSKENWDKLKKYQDSHYIFKDYLDALIISQVNEKSKLEVKKILEKNKVKYEMTKANAFEILDQNLKFIKSNANFLKKY